MKVFPFIFPLTNWSLVLIELALGLSPGAVQYLVMPDRPLYIIQPAKVASGVTVLHATAETHPHLAGWWVFVSSPVVEISHLLISYISQQCLLPTLACYVLQWP